QQPSIGCFASSAGRVPTTMAAPGELITITGGGFGPLNPVYTSPDSSGKYPSSAAEFHVRIAGIDVPILALARGLIAVQVPYELTPIFPPNSISIEVFENDTPLNPISLMPIQSSLTLFDTGIRESSTNLPLCAALNEDGTVNSPQNPASIESVVSL